MNNEELWWKLVLIKLISLIDLLIQVTVSHEKKSIENFSYKREVSIIVHCQSSILNFILM